MATAADVRALEASCPWLREDFRSDLDALRESTAAAAQRFAQDVRALARLAAQVPRCAFDDRGATPWTSFRREVAVARSISDVAGLDAAQHADVHPLGQPVGAGRGGAVARHAAAGRGRGGGRRAARTRTSSRRWTGTSSR